MWICDDKDVTRRSEVQQPTSLRPSGKGGAHPSDTRSFGWSGDGTARDIARIESWVVDAADGETY